MRCEGICACTDFHTRSLSSVSFLLHSYSPPRSSSLSVDGSRWSETGDRYLLSLYLDLVFHSSSSSSPSTPNLDWGHVLHQLNKLDGGDREKILLSSRDGEAMLLVRYSDLKRCVEESYAELERQTDLAGGGGGEAYEQEEEGEYDMQAINGAHHHHHQQQQQRAGGR
jgi:hypothetical protein